MNSWNGRVRMLREQAEWLSENRADIAARINEGYGAAGPVN
jgi:hypothetical protein